MLFDKQHPDHLNAWISQRCLKQANVHSVTRKQFECFMMQEIRNKSRETVKITNNILYSALGNKDVYFRSCQLMFRGSYALSQCTDWRTKHMLSVKLHVWLIKYRYHSNKRYTTFQRIIHFHKGYIILGWGIIWIYLVWTSIWTYTISISIE